MNITLSSVHCRSHTAQLGRQEKIFIYIFLRIITIKSRALQRCAYTQFTYMDTLSNQHSPHEYKTPIRDLKRRKIRQSVRATKSSQEKIRDIRIREVQAIKDRDFISLKLNQRLREIGEHLWAAHLHLLPLPDISYLDQVELQGALGRDQDYCGYSGIISTLDQLLYDLSTEKARLLKAQIKRDNKASQIVAECSSLLTPRPINLHKEGRTIMVRAPWSPRNVETHPSPPVSSSDLGPPSLDHNYQLPAGSVSSHSAPSLVSTRNLPVQGVSSPLLRSLILNIPTRCSRPTQSALKQDLTPLVDFRSLSPLPQEQLQTQDFSKRSPPNLQDLLSRSSSPTAVPSVTADSQEEGSLLETPPRQLSPISYQPPLPCTPVSQAGTGGPMDPDPGDDLLKSFLPALM